MRRKSKAGLPARIENQILLIRGQRVMLDIDLAKIYGVPTKRLNEQVKRNSGRFPVDFMFRLKKDEADTGVLSRSQFATLKRGHNIKYLPYAFTEYGAMMAAAALRDLYAKIRPLLIAPGEKLKRKIGFHP